MQTSDFSALLSGLLNLPDLLILAAVLVNLVIGVRSGVVRMLYGLLGRAAALAGAFFVARWAAPFVARMVVTPIVGDLFEKQAQFGAAAGVLDGLRQSVTEAAVNMAESIAFLALQVLFGILFGFLVSLAAKSLTFISRHTPLGLLDALAGGLVGAAAGVLLVVLVLLGIEWFSPITYTSLGLLSPRRTADTVLLAWLIDLLPVAI